MGLEWWFFSCTKWAKKELKIRNWFKYGLLPLFQWNPEETWVTLWVCLLKKKIKQCFINVNQDFQEVDDERATCSWLALCQTWRVEAQEYHLCISHSVCWRLRKWHSKAVLASRPPTFTESHAIVCFSCIYIYTVYIQRSPVLSRIVSPCSVHTSWSKMVQAGHLKSHYVVCTDSHIVRLAGVYKILWP